MEKMSKEDEARILRALEDAVQMTNKGVPPNEALQKVAEQQKFGPQVIQRMVEAFNVSKTLSHMKHAEGPKKADTFPIADAAPILEGMYPEKVASPREKAASKYVPVEYLEKRDVNFMDLLPKVAQALPKVEKAPAFPRDPNAAARRIMHQRTTLKRAHAQAETGYRSAWGRLDAHAKEAAHYFRQIPHTPFSEVERNVVGDHGVIGKAAMDLVFQHARIKEERNAIKQASATAYDASVQPYTFIKSAIGVAWELEKLAADVVDAEFKLEEFEVEHGFRKKADPSPGVLDEFLSPLPYEDNALVPFEKSALVSPSTLLSGGMRALSMSEPDPEGLREEAITEVYDPAHEEELRAIKTKAMLNDLLSNDPVIAGHPKERVLHTYNQIASSMPQVSQQPAVLRGLLRRMLTQEEVIEPHEIKQFTDVEQQLRGLTGDPFA